MPEGEVAEGVTRAFRPIYQEVEDYIEAISRAMTPELAEEAAGELLNSIRSTLDYQISHAAMSLYFMSLKDDPTGNFAAAYMKFRELAQEIWDQSEEKDEAHPSLLAQQFAKGQALKPKIEEALAPLES